MSAIVKKDLFSPLFDDVFSNFFDNGFFSKDNSYRYSTVGSVMQPGGSYTVDLPGVRKEDLKVELEGQKVTISWSRGETNGNLITYVPEGTSEIEATLDLGVLTLSVPGSPKKPPGKKEIKIK